MNIPNLIYWFKWKVVKIQSDLLILLILRLNGSLKISSI